MPLISKEFYEDDDEQVLAIAWEFLLKVQGSNSRIERQRVESSGNLEVICLKGTTFLRSSSKRSLVGLSARAV